MWVKAYDYQKDYGRRISIEERVKAIQFINGFEPANAMEVRDKKILQYAFVENLSAQAIVRKGDPDLIGIGNRSKGEPLTEVSICRIINNYVPSAKRMSKPNRTRIAMIRKREKTESPHIKACAFCGGQERLEEHHMIPLFMGGTNDDDNLIYLCKPCHRRVTEYQRQFRKADEMR